ncbi:hypothetical protein D9756_000892 [Leucocoprinus leucothites]|uniref:Uncharacterized protein n=1 Tax=Leucocoprinus leucothites TaxID=201217 RepID=A0A8H5GG99_9AGAR|nr:hypothetical protein D9756_000892 [Leucoagaricus leucothites]
MLIISLLALVHFVSASSLLSVVHPNRALAVDNIGAIVARQSPTPTGTVPTACKADCDPVNAEVGQGCTPAQCCQASFVTQYFNCLKCVGGALNLTDFTPAQEVLDDLTVQCSSRGLTVPKLTLPGIDPNRPLPSAPATANQTPSSGQSTAATFPMTTLQPAATGTAPPQTTTTPSSAKAERFGAPHFSHVYASAVMLGSLIYLAL